MRAVFRRFALLLAWCAAGCGFTDKDRSQPPDLGAGRDAAVGDDGPIVDGPADGPSDVASDGLPPGWICLPIYYGDTACDCGCGAEDVDCAGQGCSAIGCCNDTTCLPVGCSYCGPDGDDECDGLSDQCSEGECQTGTCVAVALGLGFPCDDGLFCTNLDECNASGACIGSGNTCVGHNASPDCDDSCNEAADACTAADGSGTSCDEDGDLSSGMCSGTLTEPNCVGD